MLTLLDRLAGAARPWLRYLAGGLAVLVLVIVGWRLLGRGKAVPVEAQLPRASGAPPAASGPSPSTAGPVAEGAPLVVHVAGAVVQPGLHDLAAGARVADALAAAGGAAPDADLDRLNLAAPLADGQRVYVLRRGEAGEPAVVGGGGGGVGPSASGSGAAPAPIDLNTATAEQLDTLPGVGPSTAQAILAYRQQHGRFRSVDELLEVRGIGDARMEQLRPLVVVR